MAVINFPDAPSVSQIHTDGNAVDWICTAITPSIWERIGNKIADIVVDLSPQLGAALDTNGFTIDTASYRQIADDTIASGTHTFNYANGDMQQLTVTGASTIAFSGFPANQVCGFIVDAINWGDFTITLPAGMLFSAATAPTFTSGGTDRLLVLQDKDNVLTMTVSNAGLAVVV